MGAEEPFRPRAALPGAQDRLVVGTRRHRTFQRRSRAGLSRSGRPERVCAVSARVRSPLASGRGAGGEGISDVDLLVWTTTPWTLPSNQFAAVNPELEYSVVEFDGEPRTTDHRLGTGRGDRRRRSARTFTVEATVSGAGPCSACAMCRRFDYYYKRFDSGRAIGLLERRRRGLSSIGGWWRPTS